MKKLVVLIIPILLLTACTSNEEDKIAYLESVSYTHLRAHET